MRGCDVHKNLHHLLDSTEELQGNVIYEWRSNVYNRLNIQESMNISEMLVMIYRISYGCTRLKQGHLGRFLYSEQRSVCICGVGGWAKRLSILDHSLMLPTVGIVSAIR